MTSTRVMPAMAFVCLLGGPAAAQQGFYLPTPSTSYGQDEFRAADGTSCRSTMDGARHLEVGAFRSDNPNDGGLYVLQGLPGQTKQRNTGVYGRFSISLDAPTQRMDCTALYRLEIERRTLENEMMKQSLNAANNRLDELKGSVAQAPAAPPPVSDGATEATGSIPKRKNRRPKPYNVADELRRLPPP
ncbi:hypothetical protein ACFQI3_08620 [Hansschlegelia quercus]|uniref:Uncharacterized protein n=1 Tax=Hansschlegelia quercus TaxID=2528245 RepID=A0A4Q9GJA0_9HYPH|nr:hypothetical protein [Hansschlegelia quercus]TBN54158.1 hypothetical protein EYR15_04705 [Hansschlegelia quercus]